MGPNSPRRIRPGHQRHREVQPAFEPEGADGIDLAPNKGQAELGERSVSEAELDDPVSALKVATTGTQGQDSNLTWRLD